MDRRTKFVELIFFICVIAAVIVYNICGGKGRDSAPEETPNVTSAPAQTPDVTSTFEVFVPESIPEITPEPDIKSYGAKADGYYEEAAGVIINEEGLEIITNPEEGAQ